MKRVSTAALAATGATIMAALPQFDLDRAATRVAKEHPDWSKERLERAESDYRAFLAVAKQNPGGKHRPSKDVDEVWHAHLLHTKDYMRDCNAYFGYYFHHEPEETSGRYTGLGDYGMVPANADCQGGGDGCTSCGSGCNGGGT